MLTPKKLNEFKELILTERDRLLVELGYLSEPSLTDALNESSQGGNAYAYHMADQGTDAQEREKAYIFAARDNKYLSQLGDALERIEDGSYGICTVCGKLIEEKRLKAVLVAKQHIECKNKKIIEPEPKSSKKKK